MSVLSSILQRFQRLPRAIQWLLFAITLVVLFRLWDAFLKPTADDWKVQADDIASQVAEIRRSSEMADRLGDRGTAELVLAIGPVAKPQSETDGGKLLHDAAIEVTRDYRSVTDMSFALRGAGGRLQRNLSAGITGGTRISRLNAELKFTASPEDTIAIIADLEKHPDVESISAVRLTRSGEGETLKVSLDLEAWVEEGP